MNQLNPKTDSILRFRRLWGLREQGNKVTVGQPINLTFGNNIGKDNTDKHPKF